MKRIFKYGTGQEVPEGSIYMYSTKNGIMDREKGLLYVWHYFLVEVVR